MATSDASAYEYLRVIHEKIIHGYIRRIIIIRFYGRFYTNRLYPLIAV